MAEAAQRLDEIAPLTPGEERFTKLSDRELLTCTRRLVGATNQILAELLAHLAEVEARGAHRVRLCTSLYTYCIYELQFSEDAAFRRVSAARLLRKFPALYDVIASGELHLTGLLQLGPHLTADNLAELLGRAKHRTKKEIAKLVRQIDPLPDVPARIEPLGPVLPAPVAPRNPTWSEYMTMLSPVNHLPPGDRPRDWMSDTPFSLVAPSTVLENRGSRLHLPASAEGRQQVDSVDESGVARAASVAQPDRATAATEDVDGPTTHDQLADGTSQCSLGPQRYSVQFTAGQGYVELVARAQALLSHGEQASLEQVHLRAMEALVAELERKRFAFGEKKRPSPEKVAPSAPRPRDPVVVEEQHSTPANLDAPERGMRKAVDSLPVDDAAVIEVMERSAQQKLRQRRGDAKRGEGPPRQRGRNVPAAVRRAVFERDGLRCTHVDDETGARCSETHRLEFHHVHAFALGGEHSAENVTLRCRAHNGFAAERDFGVEAMRLAKEGARHESFSRQADPESPSSTARSTIERPAPAR